MNERSLAPSIEASEDGDGALRLRGDWTLRALASTAEVYRKRLVEAGHAGYWDIEGIHRLDSFGATLIWHAWGEQWPEELKATEQQRTVLEGVGRASAEPLPRRPRQRVSDLVATLGFGLFGFWRHVVDFVSLIGQLCLELLYLLRHPAEWPLREITANTFKVGVRAMPVAALVGFLIGVVLSYLSALQLQNFGADIFIVNILGLGIIRELGPVLVSILVAGRSGSAMTAQLGVMRVTEEVDALSAMGISRTLRLVLPKVIALAIAMPLLVVWTSSIAIFGGMVSAWMQMGLSFGFFLEALPAAVPLANIFIALTKGFVFGILIALIACHYGLRVKPNTESLSANTTASVVTSITMVILVDAIFAIATRSIGVPF